MRAHLRILLLLTVIGLMWFWPLLLNPTKILYSDHSDLLAMHLPMKHFSVSSYQRTGEMPLWCPYCFSGMPFVHDVQVAAYYPLHWPLYWLSTSSLGPAMSWLIVLHFLIAGWAMYAYGRATQLTAAGGFAAAAGWMLSGKWVLHVLDGGHYILTPLAWMPVVMLLMFKATQSGLVRAVYRLAWAVGAGLVFGMIALGAHPQITFYMGIAIALAVMLHVVTASSRHCIESSVTAADATTVDDAVAKPALNRMVSGVGWGAICAIIAVGIGAVQLLPAMEATPYTTRSIGVAASDALAGGMRTLVSFVGPAIVAPVPSGRWEDRGGFAIITVILATFAATTRNDSRTRSHVILAGSLVLFSLGGAILFQWLPGFRLFRQSTRMILIAAMPVAWLAGAGIESFALIVPDQLERRKKSANRVLVAVGIMTGGLAIRSLVSGEDLLFHPYWLSLLVSVPTIWFILYSKTATRFPPRWISTIVTIVFVADLLAMAIPSAVIRSENEIYPENQIARQLHDIVEPGDRVLDRDESAISLNSPLGTGVPLSLFYELEAVRGYNSFDIASYRNYLQRISRDTSELNPFNDLWTFPLVGNFPLNDQSLVDLLGVRYLVQPTTESKDILDGWVTTGIMDDRPRAYNLIDGGVRSMTSYSVYENESVLPRAFVVPRSSVHIDSADNVTLDDVVSNDRDRIRPAKIETFEPNLIELSINVTEPSVLVLADAYYPGWQCEIDGQMTPIIKAQQFFRAVRVDPGARVVRFAFKPRSLRLGRVISSMSVFVVAVIFCAAVLAKVRLPKI